MALSRRGAALGAGVIAILGLLAPGCSSRDLFVEISEQGMNSVIVACEGLTTLCDADDPDAVCDPFFCDPVGQCHLRNPCTLPYGAPWSATSTKAIKMVVFSRDTMKMRAESDCICVDVSDYACTDVADGGSSSCSHLSINDKLMSSIPKGLSFAGLTDPSNAALAMVIFQSPDGATPCADLQGGGTGLCNKENLVACAGLSVPIGSSAYDVTCASCRGGISDALGRDNEPCLTNGNECFLRTCANALF